MNTDKMKNENEMCQLRTTAKGTDLMPITEILLRIKADLLGFLVANSFNSSRIFEHRTKKYFHVVAGHNSRSM